MLFSSEVSYLKDGYGLWDDMIFMTQESSVNIDKFLGLLGLRSGYKPWSLW